MRGDATSLRTQYSRDMTGTGKSLGLKGCWLNLRDRTLGLTDEETVHQVRENAFMQFILGFAGYSNKAPFYPAMMVHFRKRF